MPGLVRNVLYVNLLEGEFQKGRKTAPKNVEVKISSFISLFNKKKDTKIKIKINKFLDCDLC